MGIYKDVPWVIGGTPLVYLNRMGRGLPGRVAVKLEYQNPFSSVKDRIGRSMIETAEAEGLLDESTLIVEPTSGNTGIALAGIAAAKGYKLLLTMPETMSVERRKLLTHLGAELVLTPGPGGMKGAIAKAQEITEQTDGAWMPNQFANPANPMAHRRTTGPEIWTATEGMVDIFVAGVGTGGTITGVGEVLKTHKPSVEVVAVEPTDSPVLSGGEPGPHKIQGIGAGFIPEILKMDLIDRISLVTSQDSFAYSRRAAKEEGLLCGISSGAALWAALAEAAKPENKDKLIVTVLPSTGERYLSTELFGD